MSAHIDFETRSTVDLRKTGVHKYAEHETTDAWVMSYSLGDKDPVKRWTPETDAPEDLFKHIADGGITVAHNAQFELAIWNHTMRRRYDWPELPLERTRCTMAMCHVLALPASLAGAAQAVGLDIDKDMEGRRLMLQMAKPRRIEEDGTVVWWDDFTRRERLYQYCDVDVEVERGLEKRLLKLNKNEELVWQMDQTINNRGVYIDLTSVNKAIDTVEAEKKTLNRRTKDITQGVVTTANQVAKIKTWCEERNVIVSSLNKAGISDLLSQELPDDVREMLEIRSAYAKSSTAKLKSMMNSASADGRSKGLFQYHGANTGRWAGRRIQLQNMPRPNIEQDDIDWAIEHIEDVELLKLIYGSPLNTVSDCLRAMITAAPGHDLICADFSAIEARVLAWLAGEEDVLNIFRSGQDIYLHEATGIYGYEITKDDKDERQIGKVATLALGYGGGVGAFQALATGYGMAVEDERAEEIKKAWREARQPTVDYWKECDHAAKSAIKDRGKVFKAGPEGRSVAYKVIGSFLFCQLPNGRCLSYPFPGLKEVGFYRDETEKVRRCSLSKLKKHEDAGLDTWTNEAITFRGLDMSNRWSELDTYGGKLVENITQAVARDLMSDAMLRLEAAGYPVVLHVHDEAAVEVPEGEKSLEEMEAIMSEVPAWAAELPIEAEGWRGKRYRK